MKAKRYFLITGILFFVVNVFSQVKILLPIDSAIKKSQGQQYDENEFVKTCFFIADEYMNIEHYDSAQLWLNKIHEVLPVKKNSLDNYFLITRQAEVYYYNNLQQLGLQESRRGLAMAEALNDSILLADSYNFLGLFYMNIDSASSSVAFYKRGLLYTKDLPNPPQYISLSKPHHLHGNLAEAYYKQGEYDSALFHNYMSLNKAKEINWQRGIAVAYSGLGDVYGAMRQNDSALINYTKAAGISMLSKDIDAALVCYGGIAKSNYGLHNMAGVDQNLSIGFALLKQHSNINRFYALRFLNSAVEIYRKRNLPGELVKALELKSGIEKANIDGNNRQIQTILNAGMENEKRILSLQVADAERKQELANTRLGLAMIGFAFLAIGFLVYRYYQNQKLAISKIRQKISQDLHDDIGASLSSLQIYGAIAEQSVQSSPAKTMEMVTRMSVQSKEIMENMNDIVWSMKTGSSSNTSIEIKIKNYAAGLLADSNIEFKYSIMPDAAAMITGISARKNVLLIAKEAMNNIAKYSRAKNAKLSLQTFQKNLELIIEDDGIGFNENDISRGNGLDNMEHRVKELKGVFNIQSFPGSGTVIKAVFPLWAIT
jgi:signal transduction histidine kinase